MDVAIVGLGVSGLAAARLALDKGEKVYVSDVKTDAGTSTRAGELEALGARVHLGHHDLDRVAAARLVVVSPGIRPDAPVLHALRDRGVGWISEPEYAIRFHQGALIAVTGTNGKSTTSVLTAHLLGSSGIEAALGGNVGSGIAPSASDLALHRPEAAWWVLEMSSFQLAHVERFCPDIGVLTNLAADHLDRYRDRAEYFADKAQLFRNANASSRWVVNGDDPAALEMAGRAEGELHLFAAHPPGEEDAGFPGSATSAFVRDGVLTLKVGKAAELPGPEEPLLPKDALRIVGRHNVMNALAAALAARLAGADADGISAGLRSFEPLPHRLEPLGERDGVLWVNDSKATNVAACVSALQSLDRPVVLLLGGKDKGEDFRPLAAVLPGKAKAVVFFGEAAPRLEAELSRELSGPSTGNPMPVLVSVDDGFDAAVGAAGSLARSGDAVVLSPACPSFDLFENYEARGHRFKDLAGLRAP